MKIVVCENCGAKYQLNDDDDIDAFECSSCTGKLRELETIVDENVSQDSSDSSSSGEVLVYCTNCGLKFQIDESDNINEFECTSCGGPLDYLSNMDDGSSTSESQESQIAQDSYYETVSYDSADDEIIPIHAESTYSDDEIVPIHAETNLEEYEIVPIHAESAYSDDEIVPIHAESDVEDDIYLETYEDQYYEDSQVYDDQYYEESSQSNQYYETALPDIDDLESSPSSFNDTYYSDEYPSYDGVDEIIPIHAEKRHLKESGDMGAGFEFDPIGGYTESYSDDGYYEDESSQIVENEVLENKLVDVTDIPEDELPETPIPLKRQELSEEDKKLFERVQNELVFDSPEEYEAFKVARYKYYVALLDLLKEEYILSLEGELKANNSVRNLIRKGGETVKQSNLRADESDALVNKETIEMMRSNRKYEPKKSNADVLIIAGLFIAIVSLAYYYFISQIMYVLIAFALGLVILAYGVYRKYTFNEYLARGRIIRERLLALPNDFYVFYAVQPPQSKDIINHVVVGPTGVFTILSQRYDSKDYKNKVKSESETDAMLSDSASIQDYRQKKNTLELQTDYDDNQSRFQFGNEEIHFTQNSQIKRKALELNEDLAIFLDKKGFNGIYIEPLIGFVNDDLAILNVILTNEDLFIDELFNKVIRGRRRLDELTVAKIARLLSYYSANCDVY